MCFKAEKVISTLPPPYPPKSTTLDQRLGKNDTFFINRKEKKKKGRREKRERKEKRKKGKKEGRKERKEAKKECKCVFRLKK